MNDSLPYPEFSERLLRVADVVLDQTGGAADEGEIDPTDFSSPNVEVVVDKLIVFESSLRDPAADPGADTQLLGDISGRWWFSKNQDNSLPEVPVTAWDSGRMDRTLPVVHGTQEPEDFAIVGMDLRKTPLIIPPNGVLRCDWTNPTVTAALAVPAGTLHLALSCKLKTRRRPVVLYLPVSLLASAGTGANGPSGTQYDQTSCRNRFSEDLECYEIRSWIDGDYGANSNWADTRTLRHFRIRPFIEPGCYGLSPQGVYIPVVGFGADRQLDHAVATVDFTDDPVHLDSDDGMGFKFTNDSATKTRMTVVEVCRRRPSR